jgi:plastocyanin
MVALAVMGLIVTTGTTVSGAVIEGHTKVAGAVVFIEGLRSAPAPKSPKIDQRNMKFVPNLLVVPSGTTVTFPNSDTVFHNVFSFYNNDRFDLGMYPNGTKKTWKFSKPGICELYCNVHPSMRARIVIVDSTVYATTDKNGSFQLKDVPDGDYTLVVMHDKTPTRHKLSVRGGKYATININL